MEIFSANFTIIEFARETLTRIEDRVELIVDRRIVKSGLSVRGESEVTWLDCPQVGLWQYDVINLAGDHRLEGEIVATAFSTRLRCIKSPRHKRAYDQPFARVAIEKATGCLTQEATHNL